jgi:hypothetical protein
MRGSQLLVGGLVSLVVMTAMPAGGEAAPRRDQVTGTAHSRVFPPGAVDLFLDVHARSGPLGEKPKGRFSLRGVAEEPGGDFDIRARVTCLRVVGALAAVGGVVVRSSAPTLATGEGFVIAVRDGGDLGMPDAFNYFIGGLPPTATECPDPQDILAHFFFEVDEGDLQVRDVQP